MGGRSGARRYLPLAVINSGYGGGDGLLSVAGLALLIALALSTWRSEVRVDASGVGVTRWRGRWVPWTEVEAVQVHPSTTLARRVLAQMGLVTSVAIIPCAGSRLRLHLQGLPQAGFRAVWQAAIDQARAHDVPVVRMGAGEGR